MRDGWRERTLAGVLWYRERQQSFVSRLFRERAASVQYHASSRRKGRVHDKKDNSIAF
ncbi:unnamed protein product, partial [Ectocarpus sp. 6 AP-2014]